MLTSTSAVAFLAAGASGAQAQAPEATASADAGKSGLEDIVVTGERNNKYGTDVVQAGSFRGAKTLDTPLTVSVITSAVLKSQQAVSLLDALRNTAGVTSSSGTPVVYNNLNIRGITVDTRANFKLDGSLNILSSVAFPLEDKDRVEVLKGASALYYGFSNPSGIVNLTMKRPTEDMTLNITQNFDSHGGAGGYVDFGDTWDTGIGSFGARINGGYSVEDPGVKYVHGHRYLVSGAFDYKPTSRLTFSFDVERFQKVINEPGSFKLGQPISTVANPYPIIGLPLLRNPKDNFGPTWATNNASETNLLGKVNYKISSNWNLSGFVGQSRLHRIRFLPQFTPTTNVNGVASAAGTLGFAAQNSIFKNVNYTAELAGVINIGPFKNDLLFGAARRLSDSHTPLANRLSVAQNYLNPVFIPYNPALIPATVADTTRIDDIGYYAFDRLSYHGWLNILGGVRKSDYTESDRTLGTKTFHATPFTYSYGAVLKPVKWASVYGTYIQGLETTPLAPTTASNANQQLPPTRSTQKEAGIKLEPRTGLLFQAAYFDIRRGSSYLNAANVFVLDGRARYRGGEVSLTGDITPDFSLFASATRLNAKQISSAPTTFILNKAGQQILLNGSPEIAATVNGKRIEATPKWTVSVAGEYRLTKLVPGLALTGGVYYVGGQAINALNENFIPAYTTYDIGASYTTKVADHAVVFRVNGQNITNKRYFNSSQGLMLAESLPSTVKFSISTSF